MKKYMKVLLVAILLGGAMAYFFYRDINKEVRAITKKEEMISLFQVGVFKNVSNAQKLASTFNRAIIYYDNLYYRVIMGVAYHEENKVKLENYCNNHNITYYIKEMRIDKTFIEKISNYENLMLKSDKDNVIESINNNILQIFESYIN